MKVFVCVDNMMGIAFNRRRQSRDRILVADAIAMADTSLLCTPYSAELLREHPRLRVSEMPLDEATRDEYVFAELLSLAPYAERIDTLILYRWNRDYPSDMSLDLSLSDFRLLCTENIVGSSHEKITKEVYVK